MLESHANTDGESTKTDEVDLPSFNHPMLQLISSAKGMPPGFELAAAALTTAFDRTRDIGYRLASAESLEAYLTQLHLGAAAPRQVMAEVWGLLVDELPCAVVWERCALVEVREQQIDVGAELDQVLPDIPAAGGPRTQVHTLCRTLQPWIDRILATPLADFVRTVDDAHATIRLLRLYAMVEPKDEWGTADGLSHRLVALLGLWRQLDDHMRCLQPIGAPQRSRQAMPVRKLPGQGFVIPSDPANAIHPAYGPQARQTLLCFLLGKDETINHVAGPLQPKDDRHVSAAGPSIEPKDGQPDVTTVPLVHLVVTQEIPPATGKEDKETLARFQALRSPLPLPRLPDGPTLRGALATLHGEFPWAGTAIDQIGGQLLAREHCGSVELAWSPVLLVGQPGCGKSRLARRLAELFALPFLPFSLAGAHDTKLLLGTARSWSSAQPSPLLQFMLTHRCARGVVLLDEVEKTSRWDSGSGSIPSVLLNLLEPETAKRWYDGFLQVPCDVSKLLFIATANSLTGLSKPLLSRMEPVLVPEPQREHFASVVRALVFDIAAEWRVPEGAIDNIDIAGIADAANNVRQMRLMILRTLANQAMTPRVLH